VLTAQWAIGGALVIGAFIALGVIVATLVPETGIVFLDYARADAGTDLPRHVWELIGH
jgi:hypothetical protein